jgi:translation initiation factor IF-2
LKGDSTGLAEGVVIESKVSKEFGNVGTVIVKRGTLKPGSFIIAGDSWAKVKRMTDENGLSVESAGPSCAVQVFGWKTLPNAGDILLQGESEVLIFNLGSS